MFYQVVSKGNIITYGRWRTGVQHTVQQTLKVSPDMLPSFRMVAFYVTPGSPKEVIADSVWVDVEDQCMGKVTLDPMALYISTITQVFSQDRVLTCLMLFTSVHV